VVPVAKPVWIAFDRRHVDDAESMLERQHLKKFCPWRQKQLPDRNIYWQNGT